MTILTFNCPWCSDEFYAGGIAYEQLGGLCPDCAGLRAWFGDGDFIRKHPKLVRRTLIFCMFVLFILFIFLIDRCG